VPVCCPGALDPDVGVQDNTVYNEDGRCLLNGYSENCLALIYAARS
jgi:hypothetical protein